jgi:hypothetical protein
MAAGNPARIAQGAPATLIWVTTLGLLLNLWIIFLQVGSISALHFKWLRAEHKALNPITIGHMGVTLFLLCLWELRFGSFRSVISRVIYRALLCLAIVLSIVAIIAAGSRGPVISLFLALSVLAFFRGTRMFNIWSVLVVTALAIVIWWFASQGESILLAKRLSNVFLDSGRENLLAHGFRSFIDSPIVGVGINPTKTYPHNLVLESFMAFGVFTGVPFTFLLVYATVKALQLARLQPNCLWVTLLFVQYSVAGMFSGALSFSSALWVLMVLVVALVKAELPQQGDLQRTPQIG